MFNKTTGIQADQIAALEEELDNAIESSDGFTYHSLTGTTQLALETLVGSKTFSKVFWWDGVQVRGVWGRVKDYFLPLFSSASTPPLARSISRVLWRSDTQLWVGGEWHITNTTGTYNTYSASVDFSLTPSSSFSPTNQTAVVLGQVAGYTLYVNISNDLFIANGVLAPSLIAGIGVTTPRVAVLTPNQRVFYRNSVNPNNVVRYTPGSGSTTIVTGFTNLYHMDWDEVNQKLILFANSLPNTTSAWKVNPDGTGLTLLVAAGSYAAGHASNYAGSTYAYIGETVIDGYLYVPVPGSPYVNTYRKYNIATGAYTTEEFDFGDAAGVLADAVIEAKGYMDSAAGFRGARTAQFWGSQYYAYLFSKLLDFKRQGTKWLLTYSTGPLSPLAGAQDELAWAILPDDGVSGKFYALSDMTFRHPDFYMIAERIYDVATKEMTLEWDQTTISADYKSLMLVFDNGLITATENIRVQFGGDTAAHYDYTYWRNVVATISNTTAAAQNHIELYALNTTTVLGGVYQLSFDTNSTVVGILVEGFTASGITTGTVNSILGTAKWNNTTPVSVNSVRIFLSGATASFPIGATVRLYGYRHTVKALQVGE